MREQGLKGFQEGEIYKERVDQTEAPASKDKPRKKVPAVFPKAREYHEAEEGPGNTGRADEEGL